MDNQHRQITGYRELDQTEIDLMNRCKQMSEDVGELVQELRDFSKCDQRWVSIGATDLQKGFMGLTRSITKPTTF